MTCNPRVNDWMNEVRVLDGGFGSECARLSSHIIDGNAAWSCLLLKEDPNLVVEIHKRFTNGNLVLKARSWDIAPKVLRSCSLHPSTLRLLDTKRLPSCCWLDQRERAGCDVISTNTYQASPDTLADALQVSRAEAVELMRHAVNLARRAVKAVTEEEEATSTAGHRKLPVLIAGALGPYGACCADGSEYTGNYVEHLEFCDLVEFHRCRAKILYDEGVDLLAWETIPSAVEVSAICEAMRALPGDAVGWLSVATENGQTTVYGDPLYKVSLEVDKCEQLFGIGVNCCIAHTAIGQALSNLNAYQEVSTSAGNEDGFHPPAPDRLPLNVTESASNRKLLILYPNSGEKWLPAPGRRERTQGHWVWPQSSGPSFWAKEMKKWAARRPEAAALDQTSDESRIVPVESERPGAADNLYPRGQWVGGCCRVTPAQIRQLAEWVKADEFRPLASQTYSQPEALANPEAGEESTPVNEKCATTSLLDGATASVSRRKSARCQRKCDSKAASPANKRRRK